MRIINLIIICLTIIIIVGTIVGGIVINELAETPYEQCLNTCKYSDKIGCAKICTEEMGEIINKLAEEMGEIINKLAEEIAPILNDYLEGEK